MFFRQVLHDDLGCASYLIGDGGEAAVVDPKWEIEDYLRLARDNELRIVHVLETHNHADHVSGRGRLRTATGATLHISGEAEVAYEHQPVADGDALRIGDTQLVATATPGHRLEHMAFLVLDGECAGEPSAVLSGDSLFVGDVARPDLAVEPEEGARGLYSSVRRLLELPDHVELWPGHVGGSLCGGGQMSEKPSSTIGLERRFNALAAEAAAGDEAAFVEALTAEQTPQPPNFEQVVELNRGELLTDAVTLKPLAPEQVAALAAEGAVVVDGREPREFDAAHLPGAVNVTATKPAVGTRASWVLGLDAALVLVAASDADAIRLARLLEAAGFRSVEGYLAGGLSAWRNEERPIETTPAIDAAALADRVRSGDVLLVDVREDDEWKEGHVPGSLHVPYHELRDEVPDELRDGRPLAVACSAGNRSSIAASLLRRAGLDQVLHVADGGIEDLPAHGVRLTDHE